MLTSDWLNLNVTYDTRGRKQPESGEVKNKGFTSVSNELLYTNRHYSLKLILYVAQNL